jgi:peptidoglycan/LPS O-acetylase OafA/YrhL
MVTQRPQQELVQQKNKLLGLEVVRFISALSVLVWHYQHFYCIANKPTDFVREIQPFYSILFIFYDYGFYGVQVFWCISGFIFFWKYRDSIASDKITFKRFFILRFSRIYPLHFATLLLVAALQESYYSKKNYYFVYQSNDISHFIYQLFLASNWGFQKGYSFNGPIWSISVEVLIYCFFFLNLRISANCFLKIAIVLVCITAKYLKISSPIFDCLIFFYIGGFSAISYKCMQTIKYRRKLFHRVLFALLASPFLILITNIYQYRYFSTLFLIFYTPILLFVCAQHFNVSPVTQKFIEAAGNMTYSSYLIHFPIQLVIALCFLTAGKKIPYNSAYFFIGFIGFTLFISCYIYKLFELPVQNYIRRNLI